ncbi:MAG: GNAT family N-acetyltransferase [Immundisolibacter sp.]|uniref:GNAT family N-acetyltransferase n=1 Tax=Immundisolibacter sp. TaxID=1934948 RepID=UPI003D1386EE
MSRSPDPTAALAGPAWLDAWFAAFSSTGERMALDTARSLWLRRDRGRVLGLPLRVLRSPTNEHTPRYDWPGDLSPAALAGWLAASRRVYAWHLLELDLLAENANAVRLLAGLPKPWRRLALLARWETPVIDLAQGADAYFAGLPQKLRANTNRAENGLGKAGELRVRDLAQDDDWQTSLDACLALESAGWKGEAGGAIARQDRTRTFYLTVLRHFQAAGALRLYGLTLDGELLAFNLLLRDGPVWYGFKTGYAEAWARQSPGNVLFRHVLKALFADGDAHTLDMLDPVTDWKRRWASRVEPRLRLRLYAPGWRAGLAYHGERIARRLALTPAGQRLIRLVRTRR